VDEYQDISEDLFHFFTRITGVNGNICATGDDAQSIYGFRSADINYIVRFRKYFPSASVFMLTRNYRSRREIVDLASLCISRNRNRIRKKIISAAGSGGTILWHPYHSENAQYLQVLDIIDNTIIDVHSIAVLFRNNYQGEILRKYASKAGNNKLSGIELLTIHGSKGLEYDTVILLGVEDGIFPSELSEIEEERRLFYVAITRAKERLHILYHSTEKGTARFAKETFLSTRWTAHRCISRTRSAIAFNRKPINRDQNHP
jgi:superfamily I DNA/RNA helicase